MLLMGDEGVSLPTLQLNGKETSITVTLSGIKDSAKVYRDSVYVHTFTSNGSWVDTPLVVGNYGYYAMNYSKGDTSKYSNEIFADAYPKIPTITVAGDIAKITVTNAEASIGDSLRIYRGTSTNPTTWVYSIAPNTAKIDSPLTEGSIYFYRARTLTNGVFRIIRQMFLIQPIKHLHLPLPALQQATL